LCGFPPQHRAETRDKGFAQRTELSARQSAIFAALRVPEPPRYLRLKTPESDPTPLAG
jgi:hypothetical protein